MNLVPDYTYKSVYEIDYKSLKKKGIKGIIFDIDNTLATYDDIVPDEKLRGLLKKLSDMDFKIFLLSNNNKNRVKIFAEELNIPHRWRACKPLKFFIKSAMRKMGLTKGETALVGDQLFTDIWGANRAGITSILVVPVSDKEDKFVAFKRKFEKMISGKNS